MRRGYKAWLITWEWAGDHAAVPEQDVIAAILRPQLSPERVKHVVELLYAAREYSAADKLAALTANPYTAQYSTVTVERRMRDGTVFRQRVPERARITCGHNPYLYARLVDNLSAKDPNDLAAGLRWDEHQYREVVRI